MAIYHLSAQVISRGKGKSCVAAAAYRSGEKILDERTGKIHDYTRKAGVGYKEILAPDQVPDWAVDRQQLWNQVEAAEKRKDAQTAREINIALPKELSFEENIELARTYVNDNFVRHGMIADLAIHMNDLDNPHAHVMLTTREITIDGFGKKNRDWNKTDFLKSWREQWQEYTNEALRKARADERIDHRSFKDRGIEQVPTVHEGPVARAMEEKGIKTERGEWNREVKEINQKIKELTEAQVIEMKKYEELKKELQAEKDKWRFFQPAEKKAVLLAKDTLGRYADMPGVRQSISELKQVIEDLGKQKQAINGAERPYETAEYLLNRIDSCRDEINQMSIKDRLFGKGKMQYKHARDYIETAQKELRSLGFTDRSDLNTKWPEFKENKEAQINEITRNIAEIEESITIFKGAEEAFTMAERRKAALEYRHDTDPKSFINLTYEEAKSINDLNKEAGRVLPLDEIQELAGKGKLILEDKLRLERAGEVLNKYDIMQSQLKRLEAPMEKAKRLVIQNAQGEYRELLGRASDIQGTLRLNMVSDRTDFNRQVQSNNEAMKQFSMFTEQGFLKVLDVVNKAAQAAGRVQYVNRVRERELAEDREHGKRKHRGNRGYEYER